jgi:hypothetical protein
MISLSLHFFLKTLSFTGLFDPVNGFPKSQAKLIQEAFENVSPFFCFDLLLTVCQIFHRHKVDLLIAGHTHMMQRMLPLFNNSVDFKDGMPHIIAGAGGSVEGLSKYDRNYNITWMMSTYNQTTGFGLLDANRSHLVWTYHSTAENFPVIDQLIIEARA